MAQTHGGPALCAGRLAAQLAGCPVPAGDPAVTRAELAAMARKLRERASPSKPVRVKLSRAIPDSDWADTDYHQGSDSYTVRIREGLTALEAELCLLHEWAHVLAPWDPHTLSPGDHDEVWGAWAARIFRVYFEVD